MKRTKLLSTVSATGILAVSAWVIAGLLQTAAVGRYTPRTDATETAYLAGPAQEYYKMFRLNPNSGKMEHQDWLNAYNETKELASYGQRALGLKWTDQGPDNQGGRTRAILVDRNNPAIVYAGSISGGLFRSMDYGNNWTQITSFDQVYCVSAITQSLDGTIWVGTGSSFFNESPAQTNWSLSGNHQTSGLFYSTDAGATWVNAAGTTTLNVYELQANPLVASEIYMSANNGMRKYSIAGGLQTVSTSLNTSSEDIQVSRDGMVLVCAIGTKTWVSNDAGVTWKDMTLATNTANPVASISQRCEYAISYDKNSNNQYNIFLSGSDANTYEAWWSIDNGNNWFKVVPNNNSFNPVGQQGNYNNIVTHVPGYPNRFFLGGIDCYEFVQNPTNPITGQFYQRSFWFLNSPAPQYIHADNHEMTWDYVNNQLYVGNDGGVFKSVDRNFNVFYASNYNYATYQCYSVAFSGENHVMAGGQDNGTQYNDHGLPSWKSHNEIMGGDGFDCDISQLNPDVMFASIYYGGAMRSNNAGSFSNFFQTSMLNYGDPGSVTGGIGPFHTTFRYAENENDGNSTDTLLWTPQPGDTVVAGDSIQVLSSTADFYFTYVVTAADVLPFGDTLFNCNTFGCTNKDTIKIINPVQSIFAIGLGAAAQGLWITREASNFSKIPKWDSFPGIISGSITSLEFSSDAYVLYVGTTSGRVYRMTGLEYYYGGTGGYMRDSIQMVEIANFGTSLPVTGIGVDPADSYHIAVTLGSYGASNIRECNNTIAASPVFNAIDGNLPAMPIYDVVIDRLNGNHIIIGTEMGIYSTDNGGVTWVPESTGLTDYGMGIVPVYALRQQWRPWSDHVKNPGVIYAGTHGRGIWSSNTLLSAKPIEDKPLSSLPGTMMIYPNPSNGTETWTNINMRSDAKNGTIFIYTLEGRMVTQSNTGRLQKGNNRVNLPTETLASGTYLVRVVAGDESFTGRAVVAK